jgi:hypothetical protein
MSADTAVDVWMAWQAANGIPRRAESMMDAGPASSGPKFHRQGVPSETTALAGLPHVPAR